MSLTGGGSPSDAELADAVTRLTAVLDGFPVELRQSLLVLAGAKRGRHAHPWVVAALVVSLCGNLVGPWVSHEAAVQAQRAVMQADQTLIVAQQQEQSAKSALATSRDAVLRCVNADLRTALLSAPPVPACNP